MNDFLRTWFLGSALVLTATVNVGLFISLIVRESASLNWLNLWTLTGSTASVLAALYFSRIWFLLLASYLLFIMAVVPATFGWIAFLYVPSFVLLTIAVISKLIATVATSGLVRRVFR